jgi:hypothetical protein
MGKVPKRIALVLRSSVKTRGARGVVKGFARGREQCLARAIMPYLVFLALEGRGLN